MEPQHERELTSKKKIKFINGKLPAPKGRPHV